MKGLIFALQFLTIIPIKTKKSIEESNIPQSIIFFPLVGLLLGLVLVSANTLCIHLSLNRFLTDAILITSLIILTGGLHLDGLADTVDALSSNKNRAEMLKIMRDSTIGTMGALSLIVVILLKLSLLYSINPKFVNISLFLMCVLSRYSLVFPMFLFPYARQEGKARAFIDGSNLKKFILTGLIALACSILFLDLKGIIPFILVMIFAFLIGKHISSKINGITGDTLGAINELTEVLVLFIIFFLGRS